MYGTTNDMGFLMGYICLVAVVHVASEVSGEAELWEDPQRSEIGLLRSLPDPLAHGLQGVWHHKESVYVSYK